MSAFTSSVGDSFEVNGLPQRDGCLAKVSAAGTILLLLEAMVADLAKTVEEHSSGKRIASLAFVEARVDTPAEFNALQPVQDEESAFNVTEFPESDGVRPR